MSMGRRRAACAAFYAKIVTLTLKPSSETHPSYTPLGAVYRCRGRTHASRHTSQIRARAGRWLIFRNRLARAMRTPGTSRPHLVLLIRERGTALWWRSEGAVNDFLDAFLELAEFVFAHEKDAPSELIEPLHRRVGVALFLIVSRQPTSPMIRRRSATIRNCAGASIATPRASSKVESEIPCSTRASRTRRAAFTYFAPINIVSAS